MTMPNWQQPQQRNAATLKAIKLRMRTVASIQKITKAMKMVAAAKLKNDERRMRAGLPFSQPVQDFMQRLPEDDGPGATTLLALTSDKGLCGGVNSGIVKATREKVKEEEAKGNQVKIMFIGNKGPPALKRLFGDRFTHSLEEVVKNPFNFTTASIIAERLVEAEPDKLKIIANKFKSMASYEPLVKNMVTKSAAKNMDKGEWSKAVDVYTFEPSVFEVWDDLHEFYYAATIFGNYLENCTCEQSSRMAAMDNAAKNAGEMLDKLSLVYNRARQAKITTELCEIISGASAV